jgi:AsmA-like C-terminal region
MGAMGKAVRSTLGGIALALAFALAVPLLVPGSYFIPEVTRLASERLAQPVEMEDLTLHLLPTPRLIGHRISVGRNSEILIGELEIVPELNSLIAGPRSLRLVRASRVAFDESAFAIQRGIPKGRDEPVPVRRLILNTVKFNHPRVDVPIFNVDVKLGERLRVREARFETTDGTMTLVVRPHGDGTAAVQLSATNWTLPFGAPLTFDALAAHGTLKGQQLEVARVEADLYGGRVVGAAHADWGKELQLAGTAQLDGVDLAPVQKALGKPAKLSGRLKADAEFSSNAKTAAELREALTLDGPFEVVGGTYQGVDLSRAHELAGERRSDDATTFEELKGTLELRGERVRLSQLCIRSPKIVAGGNVDIAPDKALSGKLHIAVARTGGFFGVPVALGGTTDEPSMQPSKGYLLSAAIGTALLPGIGTSIGLTLGGQFERSSGCR